MKIENQCCSLAQAKKLKELWIEQKCLFHWREFIHGNIETGLIFGNIVPQDEAPNAIPFAAFTAAELGVMIPADNDDSGLYATIKDMGTCETGKEINGFSIMLEPTGNPVIMYITETPVYATEAQARAALLIHLLETGALTASEANARLTA